MDYTFVEDDTGSVLKITFRDPRGELVDIAGATATLYWEDPVTGDAENREMTLGTPDADDEVHDASYQFAAGELKPPLMVFDAQVVDVDGKILSTVGPLREPVRAKFT